MNSTFINVRTAWPALALGGLSLAAAAGESAAPAATPAAAPTEAQLIASARSAAPADVGRHASIMIVNADGSMKMLHTGSNGFTCMPDDPRSPGPDPMCMDKNAMEWVHALITHAAPPAGKIGFMYMLAGGTDASNTDPYAEKPTASNHWIKTGPHVMVVGADASFYDSYPKDADPNTKSPYVMWAGTPYQHLMIPVR